MTATTKSFSQLGVKSKNLTGDKIEVPNVIDKLITVLDYRIKDSKFGRHGMCLHMQMIIEGETRVMFSGSGVLMEDIEKVPKEDFPFTTTIIKIPINTKEFFLKFT
jgi:hypothetical protein